MSCFRFRSRLLILILLASVFILSACGSTRTDDDDDSAGDDDDSAGDDDDATGDDDDATGDDDDATGDDDDATGDDDDGPGDDGMLQILVERSAEIVPGEDGIGDLFVTVFATPPSQSESADIAAVSSFEMADLSSPATVVTVPTPMPPTRPEPYAVVVFLDDDGSGAPGGPTAGDLRSVLTTFIATGDPIEIEMELSEQGPPGAPNPGN